MGATETQTIVLGGGETAAAVVVPPDVRGADAVAALALPPPRALLVLNGGTAELPERLAETIAARLEEVARVAREEDVTVVTGGTDAGILSLFGSALDGDASAPCVGVAPAGLVEPAGDVPLEPHHSHFLLVEGNEWGVESSAMMGLAAALGARCPSIAVVAGGGAGAKREVLAHVAASRAVAVLAGTGRLADELAAAVEAGVSADPDVAAAVRSGLLVVVPADAPPATLAKLLRDRLAPERSSSRGALRATFPRLRYKHGRRYPLVGRDVRAAAPALAADLAALDAELLPDFYTLDEESLRAQNAFRLGQVMVIVGGAVATALGAVQAALGGGVVTIAVVEALVAGALTGALTYARGRNAQEEFATSRLRAEKLRGEYFLFLARVAPYDAGDDGARLAALRERVGAIVGDDR